MLSLDLRAAAVVLLLLSVDHDRSASPPGPPGADDRSCRSSDEAVKNSCELLLTALRIPLVPPCQGPEASQAIDESRFERLLGARLTAW
jgi:hypothetical protein